MAVVGFLVLQCVLTLRTWFALNDIRHPAECVRDARRRALSYQLIIPWLSSHLSLLQWSLALNRCFTSIDNGS